MGNDNNPWRVQSIRLLATPESSKVRNYGKDWTIYRNFTGHLLIKAFAIHPKTEGRLDTM